MQQKIENQVINLKVKELEGAKNVEKIIQKGDIQQGYNNALFKKEYEAPFFREKSRDMARENNVASNYKVNQTPSSYSDKGRQPKSQSPIFDSSHPLKIQRTNSILQNQP